MAISSTKSMTGHLLGAAGGLEVGITALALKHQMLPPTINTRRPDPSATSDIVAQRGAPCDAGVRAVELFGFGGTNGALVFKRFG
jgi:3-oxoacyl-[acyl-carrier-protein] synthase II